MAGIRKRGKKRNVRFSDPAGEWREVAGFADKAATAQVYSHLDVSDQAAALAMVRPAESPKATRRNRRADADDALDAIRDAWPKIPQEIRDAILRMIDPFRGE